MPTRRRRSEKRAIRADGFYEDEYEELNDKGFDPMEIIDFLHRVDEQFNFEDSPSGFQITRFP